MKLKMSDSGFHRILVVDDELLVVNAVRRILAASNFIKVETSTSPQEALSMVRKFADLHLVISDYLMPGMDGLEFLAEVHRMKPDIVRIIMTGHADLKTTLRAINEVGVYKFILKPWNNHDLYWTVIRALELEKVRRENRELKKQTEEQAQRLARIEELYPGISRVERDRDGAIMLLED